MRGYRLVTHQEVKPDGILCVEVHHQNLIDVQVDVLFLRRLLREFGQLEQHHRQHHIWCISSSIFRNSLSAVAMTILQSFSQLLQAFKHR